MDGVRDTADSSTTYWHGDEAFEVRLAAADAAVEKRPRMWSNFRRQSGS